MVARNRDCFGGWIKLLVKLRVHKSGDDIFTGLRFNLLKKLREIFFGQRRFQFSLTIDQHKTTTPDIKDCYLSLLIVTTKKVIHRGATKQSQAFGCWLQCSLDEYFCFHSKVISLCKQRVGCHESYKSSQTIQGNSHWSHLRFLTIAKRALRRMRIPDFCRPSLRRSYGLTFAKRAKCSRGLCFQGFAQHLATQ